MQNKNNTICFFNSAIAWGGGEKWHFDMAVALQKKGYNILFFANEKSELSKRLEDTKIKTIKLKVTNLSFLNPLKINFIKTKLKEHNVETIIINLSQDLKLAGFAAKRAGVKNIVY
ncbi:MAG: glycosyltransferase, partial [Chlorobi bacterium]|nr:glycosyltransferase [Chlorobiota bacterium]